MLVSFKKFQAIPLSRKPSKVLVRWELEDLPPGTSLADYEFIVLRSEAQDAVPSFQHLRMTTHYVPEPDLRGHDGRNEIVTPRFQSTESRNLVAVCQPIPAADFPWYVDYAADLGALTRPLYYRVVCRKISTQESIETPVFSFDGELDMVGLYVVEEHNFLLEDTVGVPCLIYQRRRGGIACSCFDPVQKKRTSSQCRKCYGTNWLGGFHRPIDSFVDFNPNPKVSQITQWGEIQPNETRAMLSNFPTVGPGDVIRELRDSRLWRVTAVTETEKRRVPMLQYANLSEIKPGDTEYMIPVDADLVLQKTNELEYYKAKREF